mgnify:FL=1
MTPLEWTILSDALRILSPALGAWAIYLLRQILGQLKTLNHRVTKLETWTENHEKLDNERLSSIRHTVENLERIYHSNESAILHGN